MALQFSISTSKQFGTLELIGRIISDEKLQQIVAEVEKNIQAGLTNWLIDCSKLDYCNSSGLNLFIKTLTKSRNAGGDCALFNPQPTILKLLEISKLNEIFTCYTSVNEVEARFKPIA